MRTAPDMPTWMSDGACTTGQVDPETFFPDPTDPAVVARLTCAGCPIQMRCLEYALENRLEYGVWGGLTEKERRSVSRNKARLIPILLRLHTGDEATLSASARRRRTPADKRDSDEPRRGYRELLALIDVPVADVRTWAATHGHPIQPVGAMPIDILEAYLEAHTPVAA